MLLLGYSLVFVFYLKCVSALNRTHYVAVVEEEWDYAPKGNLMSSDHSVSDMFMTTQTNPPQIGSKYLKAMLVEYTDDTYTTEVPRPAYMGLLAPFFRGEVGDIIKVNIWNRAQYNYSLHPHGTFYDKDDEGAQYLDGTTGEDTEDNAIPPNAKYEYEWTIKPEYGPLQDDPACISYLYHSHDEAEIEIMSGVIGILLVCKEGTLDKTGKRNDVDKEFPLLFMGFDENFSHYQQRNIQRYVPGSDIVGNWKRFQLSNIKYSINGMIYGNLKGLEACVGDKVSLSIGSAGNDHDLHTVYIQGQTMEVYRHRAFTLPIYPGATRTAIVTVDNPGTWLLSSQSALDIKYGMQTMFTAKVCKCKAAKSPPKKLKKGKTRKHYIAAEEVWWDYAPSRRDELSGRKLTDVPNARNSFDPNAEGCPLLGVYKKAIFRGYKDENFKKRLEHPSYLGFMGPPITAEVGDKVLVFFRNKASRPYSIYAYGFFIQETKEGKDYKGPRKVEPGSTRAYEWTVPESVGPMDTDPDCIAGRYYSMVDPVGDTYAGLNGPLVICKKGVLSPKGKNKRADREFFLTFGWMDETQSPYINDSIKRQCPQKNLDDLHKMKNFTSQNKMGAINGYAWGNMASPKMCKGQKINWYVSAIGNSENDKHAPFYHGNTFRSRGSRKDTVPLIPDAFETLEMFPDNTGTWAIVDQTDDAYANGIKTRYVVEDCSRDKHKKKSYNGKSSYENSASRESGDRSRENKSSRGGKSSKEAAPRDFIFNGNTRTYYIAAIEDMWDYAPYSDIHPVTGELLTENEISKVAFIKDDTRIGQIYKKAMYREFTDGTFNEQKKRGISEQHLGLLGPMIKAEVGDKLRVVFKNMATFNYSIMPHGVMYDKANEGTNYADGVRLSVKDGGLVLPGQTYTYEWNVPERAGPTKDDFNCITWMYLSGVEPNTNVYSGLIGPLIICRKGTLTEDGRRKDVQNEYALFFELWVENFSQYLIENINMLPGKDVVLKSLINDPAWFETNVMMTINGYTFANIPDVTMKLGDKTAFYAMSYGTVYQTHTLHFHGNTFERTLASGRHRHDVMDVLPGNFETFEMKAVNPGKWLVHCHVNNHSEYGMMMEYEVVDPAATTN